MKTKNQFRHKWVANEQFIDSSFTWYCSKCDCVRSTFDGRHYTYSRNGNTFNHAPECEPNKTK